VWAVATFASLAPFTTAFNWFAGMAGGGPSLRAAPPGKDACVLFEQTPDFDEDSFNSRDYAALKSEWTSLNADAGTATAAGPEGLIADDLAFVKPWGADLSGVRIPVLLAHGGDDRIIPPSHSQWLLENLPNAELWTRPRDGHVSILNASISAMDWLQQQAEMD
jgi:pimeloyl-ACP methyl ester carboxylesterase